ncbi:alpha/beta-hydrolase [Ramaria rubella]|nr:alpha/beta-hydrolase [Ramaria rubella]
MTVVNLFCSVIATEQKSTRVWTQMYPSLYFSIIRLQGSKPASTDSARRRANTEPRHHYIEPDFVSPGEVKAQLAGPAAGFSLRTSGHSLGAALSSLAAVSLTSNFPGIPMFTYGQPRTGDVLYASMVIDPPDTNAFRCWYTLTDGIPTIIPESTTGGYKHHTFEYWQNPDLMCDASGEDPTCSDSIPSMGIDAAHLFYFNRIAVESS